MIKLFEIELTPSSLNISCWYDKY